MIGSACASPAKASGPPNGSAATAGSSSRALSWLQHNRRLVRRYDKPDDFQAFADLGCILLCYRRLLKKQPSGMSPKDTRL